MDNLANVDPGALDKLDDDEFRELLNLTLKTQEVDKRENAIKYYCPVSDDAHKIHFSKATTVGIGGGNGCLPLHAPVLMANGRWQRLDDIVEGDFVMGADPETGETCPAKVTSVWRSGVKPVYRITYSDGGWFEATAEHQVPLYLGSVRTTSKGNGKCPHKRILGDYLESINVRGASNPCKRISCVSAGDIQFTSDDKPLIDPYLLGALSRRRVCRRSELVGDFDCGDIEVDHPSHCYITSHYTIVSNSSKTETAFAEMVMCATGMFPDWAKAEMNHDYIRWKAKGPMKCRVVLANFKSQLDPMLKKFKWWEWTGVLPAGGERGHFGWIPHDMLIDGDWDKSWIAGKSVLKFKCIDPFTEELAGYSEIQFMSKEMDPLAMAGVDLQFCVMDEPSNLSVYRENKARVMRGDGRLFLPMTWSDDAGVDSDWIYDEIYDRTAESDYAWFVLKTYDNPHLPMERVLKDAANVSDTVRKIRFEGGNLRFSSRIHPLFTDTHSVWCFDCKSETTLVQNPEARCGHCGNRDIQTYCHVSEFDVQSNWPSVFIIDPHPRKPHMYQWVQVDPSDDLWQIAEGSLDDDPLGVAEDVARIEDQFGLFVNRRLMDPNMGASVCGVNRDITWQSEFDKVNLSCDLADDSSVGRSRLNEYLKPDPDTRQPRFHLHSRCEKTIQQMIRYSWDNYKQDLNRDVKQTPKQKYDDYPNNLKYLVNSNPFFQHLKLGFGKINTRVRYAKKHL